jgi:hypothetical protein
VRRARRGPTSVWSSNDEPPRTEPTGGQAARSGALILAAPGALLAGVPLVGHAIGAAAWVAGRVFGLGVERRAATANRVSEEVALWVGSRLLRVALLAGATLLAVGAGV